MKFLEEINATVGQFVKDLEHHLEKYPQIASEVITSYSDGDEDPKMSPENFWTFFRFFI